MELKVEPIYVRTIHIPRLTFTFLIFQMEHHVRQQIIEGIEH